MRLTTSRVNTVTQAVDFICELVFKDEIKGFEAETQESAYNASIYISAILKTDNLTEPERERIISNYKETNPYFKELQDKYKIEPHISRLAKDMDIIFQPEATVLRFPYLYHYRTIYKKCLQAFYVTSYSPAMIQKANYREFCLLSVNMMALLHLLNRWLETPFDIDIMSEENIDKFMYSFGISFFKSLPFKYKQLIARNLNRLISNKGTDKVIIDILEIFNFKDIDIYKYYLARKATNSVIGNTETSDYRLNKERDTYFIAHKITIPSLSIAIKNNDYKKFAYERIAESDPHWQVQKHEVTNLDFDYVQTKYFSIETGFELGAESMNTILLLNLLRRIRQDYPNKEFLSIISNIISETNLVQLEDIIITLQILTCEYQGVVDEIHYDVESITGVYDFAKVDNPVINQKLFEDNPLLIGDVSAITMRNLNQVPLYDSDTVRDIVAQNTKVKGNMESYMKQETNYQKFKRLRNAYNGKFIQQLSYKLFKPHNTYTEYLSTRNNDLYTMVENIRAISDPEERQRTLEEAISNLSDVSNTVLDKFGLFFSSTSLNIIVGYMRRVILAFKSFTVSLNDLNVFIVIREQYTTKLLDELKSITHMMMKYDRLDFEDRIDVKSKFKVRTRHKLLDYSRIYMVRRFYEFNNGDDYDFHDHLHSVNLKMNLRSNAKLKDRLAFKYNFRMDELAKLTDRVEILTKLPIFSKDEHVKLTDSLVRIRQLMVFKDTVAASKEVLIILQTFKIRADILLNKDRTKIISEFDVKSKELMRDSFKIFKPLPPIKDYIKLKDKLDVTSKLKPNDKFLNKDTISFTARMTIKHDLELKELIKMTAIGLNHKDTTNFEDIMGRLTLKFSNPKSMSKLTDKTSTGLGKDSIKIGDRFEIKVI